MKPFVILLISLLCASATVQAQTYLEHLQKQEPGKGKVTVNQSKAIDELVNGKAPAKVQQDSKTTSPQQKDNNSATAHKGDNNTAHKPETATHKTDSAKKPQTQQHPETATAETETPTVDMSKKVMRGSYKVTGYRVQAYAGGNSRADRQKAEQTGNAIKMKYPKEPVYVHFYSPRWICRVGNYRTLAEAQTMLQKIKAMGYKQACLVKGKITVQD